MKPQYMNPEDVTDESVYGDSVSYEDYVGCKLQITTPCDWETEEEDEQEKKININIGQLLMFIVMIGHLLTKTEANMTELCICILMTAYSIERR